MRKLLYALLALVGLLVLAFVLAAMLVDPQALTQPIAEQASVALGQPVQLGEVDLALFPTPAARVHSVVVGPEDAPLAEISEIRLNISLLGLLAGQVALRSLEIDEPVVKLPMGPDGLPLLPLPPAEPAKPKSEAGERAEAEVESEAALLAISEIVIRNGSIASGPWALEDLAVDGSLALDGTAAFQIGANLVGLARIDQVEVEIAGLIEGAPSWTASGELSEIALMTLRERLALDFELEGSGHAKFQAAGREEVVESGQVSFEASALKYASGEMTATGATQASAVLGEQWQLDLSNTEIRQGELLHKPAGSRLIASGELGTEPSVEALGSFRLQLIEDELRGHMDLGAASPKVTLESGTVELAPLAAWFQGEVKPSAGQLVLDDLAIGLDPLAVHGAMMIQAVELALEHGTASVSGQVRGEGSRVVAAPLEVTVGGQISTLQAVYDLESGSVQIDGDTSAAQVDPLVRALTGDSPLSGVLTSRMALAGPPTLPGLAGKGSFEITEGELRGVSIMKTVLGEISALPILMARVRGKDLSRYEEEEFRRLAGDFRLRGEYAHIDNLVLEYRNATIDLAGTVGVPSGELNLKGTLTLSKELDAELAGTEQGSAKRRVIPITGVRGTVSEPKVVLDRDALSAALATYATGGELRDRLEEQLGPGGADAVEGVLEKLLRGRREEP